ncbi:MAG: HAD-IA family hydrolase, partial [Anaerolineales bacterium]|nr:HAD-IA family hydrolase [Anaerolineales bacterium]
MIQAVIFDVGGVLLRTHDWTGRHKWDEKLGLPHGRVEHTFFNSDLGLEAQHGRVTTDQHWHNVAQRLGIPHEQLPQLRADFWAGDRFDDELADLIRQLHGRYQTAIISNAPDDLRHVLTHDFHIADAFDLIVVSAEEEVMKPDPAIYQRTLQRLGRQAEEAIFIDDSPTNIAGAQ